MSDLSKTYKLLRPRQNPTHRKVRDEWGTRGDEAGLEREAQAELDLALGEGGGEGQRRA